ncbi:MAG: hypothetical protein HY429_04600 [Candidatus Levybacteria bacterium]|nr:hypothetical protein [Candidatus Levybacteria bacterium]
MRYSLVFGKTRREAPKDEVAVNAQLLIRGGFIDKLMAGSWTLLPLGLLVINKINNIIREELNKTGANEMLMPLLHPRDVWDKSGRWSNKDVQQIMYQFKDIHEKEFGLSFTHEEIVMYILSKFIQSYKDLPVKVYHFSTKFRNEPRAKSGILRGREFMMNDLYSAHVSKKNMMQYYEEVKKTYMKLFKRIGLDVVVTEASGGVFTKEYSHEFQVFSEVGEDEIIYCPGGDFAQNTEISSVAEGKQCDLGHGPLKKARSIEVGNIFPLGTKYSKDMKVFYKDEKGQEQPIWLASYGIGPTRVMGTLVEMYHDDRGIVWPKSVAPFHCHLVAITRDTTHVTRMANDVYEKLQSAGIDVLFDDRTDVSAGEKFADADLVGIPVRLVVSEKTGDKIEWKGRKDKDTEFLTPDDVLKRLT